jgi:cell division protease FtsH
VGDLIRQQKEDGVIKQYDVKAETTLPWWAGMIPYLIIIVIFDCSGIISSPQDGGAGRVMSFGKARTKLGSEERQPKNVPGCGRARTKEKAELQELV